MRSLLYANGEIDNLGCEALSKSTVYILRNLLAGSEVDVTTQDMFHNKASLEEFADHAVKLNRGREGIFNILSEICLRVGLKKFSLVFPNTNAAKISKGYEYTFSIGGDNYCYEQREKYYRLNRGIRRNKSKNIFWGCSIEPDIIDREMLKDLSGFDYIFTRESLSYTALKNNGLDNVFMCSDPAFQLQPEQVDINFSDKCLGVNLSPLIYSYSKDAEKTKKSVVSMLNYVLNHTDYSLYFIPHVYGNNGDYKVHKDIAELLCSNDRVVLIEEKYNSNQIKYVISKMDALICARTHASIAGYSSCVPTFVLGYSVKAKGIATDIYGDYEHHVLPVQRITAENTLLTEIIQLLGRIENEKEYLNKTMPNYIENAYSIRRVFENEFEDR